MTYVVLSISSYLMKFDCVLFLCDGKTASLLLLFLPAVLLSNHSCSSAPEGFSSNKFVVFFFKPPSLHLCSTPDTTNTFTFFYFYVNCRALFKLQCRCMTFKTFPCKLELVNSKTCATFQDIYVLAFKISQFAA